MKTPNLLFVTIMAATCLWVGQQAFAQAVSPNDRKAVGLHLEDLILNTSDSELPEQLEEFLSGLTPQMRDKKTRFFITVRSMNSKKFSGLAYGLPYVDYPKPLQCDPKLLYILRVSGGDVSGYDLATGRTASEILTSDERSYQREALENRLQAEAGLSGHSDDWIKSESPEQQLRAWKERQQILSSAAILASFQAALAANEYDGCLFRCSDEKAARDRADAEREVAKKKADEADERVSAMERFVDYNSRAELCRISKKVLNLSHEELIAGDFWDTPDGLTALAATKPPAVSKEDVLNMRQSLSGAQPAQGEQSSSRRGLN